MRQSGLDAILPTLLAQDAIVYAGFSAAAAIASRDRRGLTPSPASYDPLPGLKIAPDLIVVHYDPDHPGCDQAAEEAKYYRRNGIAPRLLHDGEALVIDGDEDGFEAFPCR